MPSYLVETYLPRERAGECLVRESRARSAAKRTSVRFERSIYVPQDEICFLVFGARSEQDVARVARRAGIDALRIVEAVSSGREET